MCVAQTKFVFHIHLIRIAVLLRTTLNEMNRALGHFSAHIGKIGARRTSRGW